MFGVLRESAARSSTCINPNRSIVKGKGDNMSDFDLIIENVLIYDGTGEPSYTGSVAVKDGKIAAVQKDRFVETSSERINASGF